MVTSALCNWYTNGNTADDIATVADADLQTLVVNLTGIAADIGEKFRGFTQAARHRSNLSCNLCILAIIAWRQTIRPTCSHAIIYRLRVYSYKLQQQQPQCTAVEMRYERRCRSQNDYQSCTAVRHKITMRHAELAAWRLVCDAGSCQVELWFSRHQRDATSPNVRVP